jgi:hypothetical protein
MPSLFSLKTDFAVTLEESDTKSDELFVGRNEVGLTSSAAVRTAVNITLLILRGKKSLLSVASASKFWAKSDEPRREFEF